MFVVAQPLPVLGTSTLDAPPAHPGPTGRIGSLERCWGRGTHFPICPALHGVQLMSGAESQNVRHAAQTADIQEPRDVHGGGRVVRLDSPEELGEVDAEILPRRVK